jgi:hypothetical protein
MKSKKISKKPKIPPNDVFGSSSGVKTRSNSLTISFLQKTRVEVGKEIISHSNSMKNPQRF